MLSAIDLLDLCVIKQLIQFVNQVSVKYTNENLQVFIL